MRDHRGSDDGQGEYRPLLVLGSGGMARVELAVRAVGTFRRLYAVKRLHPHLAADPGACAALEEEARIAGSLAHPHVVGVIDVGVDDGGPYLVMDYVEGLTLSELQTEAIRQGEAIPLEVACALALAVARALDAIHTAVDPSGRSLALVHRDLSPRNVLVGFDGGIRLIDFGIAHADGRTIRTTTGLLKGTPGYVPPERLRFEDPDPRGDLFSLGVILYELLAGERLYDGRAQAVVRRVLEEAPPDIGEVRPEAPAALVGLLFDLLAKAPDGRPPSAAAVVVALESVGTDLARDGEALAVGAYASFLGAERRALRRAEIQRALAAASAELEGATLRDRAQPEPPPTPRGWTLSLLGLVLLGAGAIAALWLRPPATPLPSPVPPPAAPPPPVSFVAPDDPVVTGAQDGEPAAAPTIPEPDAARGRRSSRRRRATRRGSRMEPAVPEPSSPMAAGAREGSGAFPREMDWDGELR